MNWRNYIMQYNYSDRLKDLSGNAIREIFKLLTKPEVISFAGGLPATNCLPVKQFEEFCSQLLQEKGAMLLQYGATEGYMPLRLAMINYVKRCGIQNITADNVLIISGGQQAIDLTFKAFINKGDAVLVEDPTYLAVLHIAKTYEAQVFGVNSGDEGIDLVDLEQKIKDKKPKIFYIVPNFSNPTGRTLSAEKRKSIAEICAKYNVMVLEDDPYRELRYFGKPQPSIKSFDTAGNVIYASSFSKTISPGMRVGSAIADPAVIRKLTVGKQAVDVQTVTLMQAVAERFIQDDTLDKHIEKSIPVYREKKVAMIDAIKKFMPSEFKYTDPEGGLFIWGEYPNVSVKDKFSEAIANNVAYIWGTEFYADGRGGDCMRLNFSNASVEQIYTGIERLSKVFKK